MPSTTHAEFNDKTEALEVAKAFASGIQGKTILITGVNVQGIGYTTAEAFASQSPAHLIVAGRSVSKLQASIDALKSQYPSVDYRPLELDLSSQAAVRRAAAQVLAWTDVPAIDIIVNSAGVMYLPERTLSPDGIEMHLATNHIGHFLFSCLVMPKLLRAAASATTPGATRIVNVSSLSPYMAQMRWSDVNFDKPNRDLPTAEQPVYDIHRAWGVTGDLEAASYLPLEGYNQSKVANVLFSVGATRRLFAAHGILSVALHPGVIETELGRNQDQATRDAIENFITSGAVEFRTPGAGASTSLVAALDPQLAVDVGQPRNDRDNYGVYLQDCQIRDDCRPTSVSTAEADRLWALSEDLVKEKFSW